MFIKALDERVLNSLSETALSFKTAFEQQADPAVDRTNLYNMTNKVMEGYLEQMRNALGIEAAAGDSDGF